MPQQEGVVTQGRASEAPAEIKPVHSWAHDREVLKSDGKSEAEIAARIEKGLASARTMDRAAGSDRIGVAAPPLQFDGWLNSAPLHDQYSATGLTVIGVFHPKAGRDHPLDVARGRSRTGG